MVPQDTVLFNDTIAYNVRYGRIGASEEDLDQAAEMAQIAGFIKRLPRRLPHEWWAERGLKLSGGEKQRVAIARTIFEGPAHPHPRRGDIGSRHADRAGDPVGARHRQPRGVPPFVIAHRLSTVVSADEIIVLKDGEIAERGRHGELLAKGELYAAMWDRQREATEAEARLAQGAMRKTKWAWWCAGGQPRSEQSGRFRCGQGGFPAKQATHQPPEAARFMSLVDTIKNTFVPINREGWPFIAGFCRRDTDSSRCFPRRCSWLGLILTAWCTYFFRDPERITPRRRPAGDQSGRRFRQCRWTGRSPARARSRRRRRLTRISVFMNVFFGACEIARRCADGYRASNIGPASS